MRKITKLFKTKATSVDEVNHTVTFKISDNQVDRGGEIVDQKSWNFKEYMDNPMFLWGHNPDEPENVLGQCINLWTEDDGSATYGTYQFDVDINPKAGLIFNQVKRGSLRTVSVGFLNHLEELSGGTPILKDNDMLETSIVPIPMNSRAIALSYKEGSLSKKDANWLLESMRKEANFLEEQMKQDNPKENSTMDEQTSKQMSALLAGITKLAETQAETNKNLEALTTKGAVADILAADHSWEAQDDKWDNMEVVADMYYAFCEAYFYTATPVGDFMTLLAEFIGLLQEVVNGSYSEDADAEGAVAKSLKDIDAIRVKGLVAGFFAKKKEAAESTEAKPDPEKPEETDKPTDPKPADPEADKPAPEKKPEGGEDDDTKKKPEDDSAKGGGDDQPGAKTDDELDLDAELTPELEAQADSALETVGA